MSLSPDKIGPTFDFLSGTGGAVTTTGAGTVVTLPPGKKAIQVNMGTGIVATLKVQNSVDGTNWFDVTTNATAAAGNMYEVESVVPKWRTNFTVMTTAATTSSPFVALITQQIL
jgi:hypothetical protein